MYGSSISCKRLVISPSTVISIPMVCDAPVYPGCAAGDVEDEPVVVLSGWLRPSVSLLVANLLLLSQFRPGCFSFGLVEGLASPLLCFLLSLVQQPLHG